eukprot:4801277-Pyramimonas_sp.AAC.1
MGDRSFVSAPEGANGNLKRTTGDATWMATLQSHCKLYAFPCQTEDTKPPTGIMNGPGEDTAEICPTTFRPQLDRI